MPTFKGKLIFANVICKGTLVTRKGLILRESWTMRVMKPINNIEYK